VPKEVFALTGMIRYRIAKQSYCGAKSAPQFVYAQGRVRNFTAYTVWAPRAASRGRKSSLLDGRL